MSLGVLLANTSAILSLALTSLPVQAPQASVSDAELQQLARLYKEFGLPEVPSKAQLLLVVPWPESSRAKWPAFPAYGFEGKLYVGSKVLGGPGGLPIASTSADETAQTARLSLGRRGMYSDEDIFVTVAAVAASRGKYEFARELLAKRTERDEFGRLTNFGFGIAYQPAACPPAEALTGIAFGYHAMSLATSERSRADILLSLNRVMEIGVLPGAEVLELRKDFIKNLETAMEPITAKEGSPEWIVADLVNSRTQAARFQFDPDDRLLRLLRLGFAGVPAAIERLGDKRLTRTLHGGGGASGPRMLTLDDLVADFIDRMSAGRVHQLQHVITKETAQAWWESVKNQPEKDYLLANALFKPENGEVPFLLVQLVAERYPEELVNLYRKSVEADNQSHMEIARQIARCSLSNEEKIKILEVGAKSERLRIAGFALTKLAELRDLQAPALMRAIVDRLPAGLPESPSENGSPFDLTSPMNMIDDQVAWRALAAKVHQMGTWQRLSIAEGVASKYEQAENAATVSAAKLELLRSLIQDSGEFPSDRTSLVANRPATVAADVHPPMIRVGDMAAVQAARLMNLGKHPSPWDRKEDWDAFRLRVAEALDSAIREGGYTFRYSTKR